MKYMFIKSADDFAEEILKRTKQELGYSVLGLKEVLLSVISAISIPDTINDFAQALKDECFDPLVMDKSTGQYSGEFDLSRASAMLAAWQCELVTKIDNVTNELNSYKYKKEASGTSNKNHVQKAKKHKSLITMHEYADAVGRCYLSAFRDVKYGRIPSVKIGGRIYIPSDVIEKLIASSKENEKKDGAK